MGAGLDIARVLGVHEVEHVFAAGIHRQLPAGKGSLDGCRHQYIVASGSTAPALLATIHQAKELLTTLFPHALKQSLIGTVDACFACCLHRRHGLPEILIGWITGVEASGSTLAK